MSWVWALKVKHVAAIDLPRESSTAYRARGRESGIRLRKLSERRLGNIVERVGRIKATANLGIASQEGLNMSQTQGRAVARGTVGSAGRFCWWVWLPAA